MKVKIYPLCYTFDFQIMVDKNLFTEKQTVYSLYKLCSYRNERVDNCKKCDLEIDINENGMKYYIEYKLMGGKR